MIHGITTNSERGLKNQRNERKGKKRLYNNQTYNLIATRRECVTAPLCVSPAKFPLSLVCLLF